MLAELTFAENLVLAGGVLVGGLFAILIAMLPRKSGASAAALAPADDVSFVFRDNELIDVSLMGELLLGSPDASPQSWEVLRQIWTTRFGDLPNQIDDIFAEASNSVVQRLAQASDDDGRLLFRQRGEAVHIALIDTPTAAVERQELQQARHTLNALDAALDQAPDPVWITDANGKVQYHNAAYRDLGARVRKQECDDAAEEASGDALFAIDSLKEADTPVRIPLQTGSDDAARIWFEVTTRPHQDGHVFYASNVDAVVRAEVAQRNFVQTLTKTFAQLSIGLAIFDRNQQLALFNPALIDLTMLPAEFLSARPDLLSFFDHLRDERIMPEPKNYASWRDQMTALVAAARDGRYSETWNLSSGLTYRVSGKPHPDGAVAFLFEDISAEISLTRRFRADLELSHVVLDRQSSALAVFSQLGVLSFTNEAFREMWDCDPDSSFADTAIADAVRIWAAQCDDSSALDGLPSFVTGFGPRTAFTSEILHETYGVLQLRAETLPGGSTLLNFVRMAQVPKTEVTRNKAG